MLFRLSLIKGLSRLFSFKGLTEFLKSIPQARRRARRSSPSFWQASASRFINSMFMDIGELPEHIVGVLIRLLSAVVVATTVLASADVVWARVHWRRDHQMSHQEIKEEIKASEGDPMRKARLRSIRLDRSRKRMLAGVPKATMVVVNPTHYAVALRYVRSEGGVPMVVAKGLDLIALKIREIAEQNNIPVIEDKPLARSLYEVVTVDSVIPAEFYRTIAEVIHLIQTKSEQLADRQTWIARMTSAAGRTNFRPLEKIIAESIVDVATELRLADVSDLMLFIRCDQAANIEDLVNSSTELYFKNGTLKYALAAGCSVRWDALHHRKRSLLDLTSNSRHAAVTVIFQAGLLSQSRAAVEIIDIFFEETGLSQDVQTQRLVEAVADAKAAGPTRLSSAVGGLTRTQGRSVFASLGQDMAANLADKH